MTGERGQARRGRRACRIQPRVAPAYGGYWPTRPYSHTECRSTRHSGGIGARATLNPRPLVPTASTPGRAESRRPGRSTPVALSSRRTAPSRVHPVLGRVSSTVGGGRQAACGAAPRGGEFDRALLSGRCGAHLMRGLHAPVRRVKSNGGAHTALYSDSPTASRASSKSRYSRTSMTRPAFTA